MGHALVDVIAQVGDGVIAELGLAKGTMRLLDAPGAERMEDLMDGAQTSSGGAAANTAVGAASFGRAAAFLGRVAADALGRRFAEDLEAAGVRFAARPAEGPEGPGTGRCMVLVTPDGERTMGTYLGASACFGPGDVDAAIVRAARVLYVEAYLWDCPEALDAIALARAEAAGAGALVALSLSDPLLVERHREALADLALAGPGLGADVVLGNEAEAKALVGAGSLEEAVSALVGAGVSGAVTRGAAGSVALGKGGPQAVPASAVERVVDTTGAGDLFAAGFLAGLCSGMEPLHCARLGSLAAGEVVSHIGARPQAPLCELAQAAGLL